jgi:hypothetical protein
MEEREEFFSPKHKQLLGIALWAKYLAWFVLAVFILRAGLVIFQKQVNFQQTYAVMGSSTSAQGYWDMVRDDPLYYGFDIGADMAGMLLSGAVYYVVLKGISLGLNMIVETDVNYREKENQGGLQ